MKRTGLFLLLFLLTGCEILSEHWQQLSKTMNIVSTNSSGKIEQCSEQPQANIDPKNIKLITLTAVNTKESGQIRQGNYLAYQFPAKAGQQLNYRTEDNLCIWIYAPDRQLIKTKDLPQTGQYTMVLTALKGATTFDIKMNLSSRGVTGTQPLQPLPPFANSPTPSPTPTATASISPEVKTPTERVTFDPGTTGKTVTGTIKPTEKRQYTLECAAGQKMSIDVKEGTVNINIIDPNGQTIGTIKNGKNWQGELPTNGDYSIEVSAPKDANFKLNVDVSAL
ncbi:hypothetical protein PL8927_830052 [Planktothrix serta PCC 8927]|uniref:Uncharacterized protein n=1 Tax=Planktothrix serta PCC 8927 TaxID=671068 RepID=A0A7Z9BXQ2_9CYAN|nr:hypothetical protein [Planktothrix serta]VXD24671.1 hypothetical protein PL8927_830052 [Planktothrix serta PCC 8927]